MRNLFLALIAGSLTVLASSAYAQQGGEGLLVEQESQQVLTDRYLGSSVFTGQGENMESIGEVSALILEDGEIVGAVVDVGGFLGIGAKPVGLDWSLLSSESVGDSTVFTTSLTRQDFEQAPEYKDKAAQRAEQRRQEMEAEQQSEQNTGTTY